MVFILVPHVQHLIDVYYSLTEGNKRDQTTILKTIAGLLIMYCGGSLSDKELLQQLVLNYPSLQLSLYFNDMMLAFLLVQRNSWISLKRFHLQ